MYILWIRHGFSCANYLSTVDPIYVVTGRNEYDARLTGLGVRQASTTAPIIFRKMIRIEGLTVIPLIFTSMLSRAIETSDGVNKGLLEDSFIQKPYPIVTIPYVEEIPLSVKASQFIYLDRQNEPRNIHKVRKDIGVDVSVYEEINPYDEYGDPITTFNIERFYEDSLPKIIKLLKKEGHKITDDTVITIVSHRKTIEKATGVSVGNVGAVLQNFEIFNSSEEDLNYKPIDCEILFEGFSDKWGLENILLEDLKDRCRSERPIELFQKKVDRN